LKDRKPYKLAREFSALDSNILQDSDKEKTILDSNASPKSDEDFLQFNKELLHAKEEISSLDKPKTNLDDFERHTQTIPEINGVENHTSYPDQGERENEIVDPNISLEREGELTLTNPEIINEREEELTLTNPEIINEREDELLYFAFMKHGIPLFEMDFYVEGMKHDPTLLAGFISAVSTFSKELSDKGLKTIDQGNLKVGFVESDRVSLFYLAGSISDELESKLKLLFTQFESRYYQFLSDDFIGDESLFIDFKPFVLKTLAQSTVKKHYIPTMVVAKSEAMQKYLSSIDIIDLIDGRKTVAEIAMYVSEDTSSVSKILSLMKIEGLIEFEIDVTSHDVFVITSIGFKRIFSNSVLREQLISLFGEDVFDLIRTVDGTKSVIQIAHANEVNISKIQQVLSMLLAQEYVSHVPERIKAILVIDCLFKNLYDNLSKYISKITAYEMISENISSSDSILINAVRFQKGHLNFKLCYDYLLNAKEIESFEIYEEFMDPLLTIFDIVGDIDSDEDLRLLAFEEANNLYGVIF